MKIHKLIIPVISLSLFLQAVIIANNHFSGYAVLSGVGGFISRLLIGTFFSSLMGLGVVVLDELCIRFISRRFTWERDYPARIIAELAGAVFIAAPLMVLLTLIVHTIGPYKNPLAEVIRINVLIGTGVNIVIFIVLEAYFFFREKKALKERTSELERENMSIRFETLKNQLNPHFLFNSLNVLAALIGKDAKRAGKFVDEFASVYRYILDVIDKHAVEVRQEIAFVESYLYLNKIRFGDALHFTITSDSGLNNSLIPPLALQTVIENALKHNSATVENPLIITITLKDNSIEVINNLQRKTRHAERSGIGIENLRKRYLYITDREPEFFQAEQNYIAILPLIVPE